MTLESKRENDICSVCGWEDDWWDSNNPDSPPLSNWLTLNEARELYKKTGRNILDIQKERKKQGIK